MSRTRSFTTTTAKLTPCSSTNATSQVDIADWLLAKEPRALTSDIPAGYTGTQQFADPQALGRVAGQTEAGAGRPRLFRFWGGCMSRAYAESIAASFCRSHRARLASIGCCPTTTTSTRCGENRD